MKTEINRPLTQSSSGTRNPSLLKRLTGLMVSIILILVFMLYLGPWLEQSSMVQPIARFIEAHDIKANMYFYTEVEEFSEANLNMQNSMDFPPRSPL
jgi:hypothetical protein